MIDEVRPEGPSETVALSEQAADGVATLCPACGLCCNGVLFADVELLPGDNASGLRAQELKLKRKRKGKKRALEQPCACWDGTYCRIYAVRPTQCRAFVCGTLMRVQTRKVSARQALKVITEARRQVQAIEKLLLRLGNTDAHLPLTRRYAAIMAEPLDLAGDLEVVKLRAGLMRRMASLMKFLDRHFRA